jgi:hypothetical protein
MPDQHNEDFEAVHNDAAPEPVPPEATTPSTPSPPLAEPPIYGRRSRSRAAFWLAGLLLIIIVGVLSSPFWAAAVGPLLPWGEQPAAARYAALAQRVTALEIRPVAPPLDPDAIKSVQSALAQRITALEERVAALRQTQREAATKAALAQQAQRLDVAEAHSEARAAAQAADIEKIRQQLAQRSATGGEIATRLDELERQVHARDSIDRSEGIRMLALLQMREAVEAGRPFPVEYAAFSQLAAHDPELAAAARPLADAARSGVAGLGELRRRLGELADRVDAVQAPPAKSKWWEAALDRVRALVNVRRIDGTKTRPDAAVSAAQMALAQGSLAGAVGALDGLSDRSAESAQSWLKMARQRLAAEAALTHLQGLLTAQLGAQPTSPAATTPEPAPVTPPAVSKTPS